MQRFIPIRLKALILAIAAIALVVPSVAQAGPREDVFALAAAARALGETSRADEIEALAGAMSDEDAQTLSNAGVARLTAAFQALAQKRAEAAREKAPLSSLSDVQGRIGKHVGRSAVDFPEPEYPDPSQCTVSPDGSDFNALFPTFVAVQTARTAYEAAEDILSGLYWACETVVVAIGVGGNPQTVACGIAEVALAIANTALNIAEEALEIVDFCDGVLQWIDTRTTLDRTAHIHDDLENARVEILDRLETHDADIKVILAEILARLDVIEGKLDLGLKSQAEIAMHTRFRNRPSVFYEERLDEICGYAQEAINDLPIVYLAAGSAQNILDKAVQFKVTDPKRAADGCIQAFLSATVRADNIQ